MTSISGSQRTLGCLLGGAVGDALGAPIEFADLDTIQRNHGPLGLTQYAPAYGRLGAITDDTQMTLFTAEGAIRAWVRGELKGICHPSSVIHHAYLRWLLTQGEQPARIEEIGTDGWLFGIEQLHARRAPGNTCISALKQARAFNVPETAQNNSKGCGGVMRIAPIGLMAPLFGSDQEIFHLGASAAALTHGHVTGALSAGYLALTVAGLCRGEPLTGALDTADAELANHPGNEEVAGAVAAARRLAAMGTPDPTALEKLGGGWVAEEALAIAVCCALCAQKFSDGVILAVNHSGDSDSTGSIAGNLLGAALGYEAIPSKWLDQLELQTQIARLADDICQAVSGTAPAEQFWDRYPGW